MKGGWTCQSYDWSSSRSSSIWENKSGFVKHRTGVKEKDDHTKILFIPREVKTEILLPPVWTKSILQFQELLSALPTCLCTEFVWRWHWCPQAWVWPLSHRDPLYDQDHLSWSGAGWSVAGHSLSLYNTFLLLLLLARIPGYYFKSLWEKKANSIQFYLMKVMSQAKSSKSWNNDIFNFKIQFHYLIKYKDYWVSVQLIGYSILHFTLWG